MLRDMTDWKSIIVALGGTGAVADALEQKWDSTVSGWQTRGIPSCHWVALVALAAELNKPDITLEVFAVLAASDRARKLEEARA